MPDLIIAQNVPQDKLDRIIAAYVALHGPIPMSAPIPAVLDASGNVITPAVPAAPLYTPAQFTRRAIMAQVKNCVLLYEQEAAGKPVRDAARVAAVEDFKSF